MNNQWCQMGTEKFATGSQVCDGKKCYICADGYWMDTFSDLIYSFGP
jgi:hypothetical protein